MTLGTTVDANLSESRRLEHEIRINASLADVLVSLTTIEGLQGWHTEKVSGAATVGSTIQMDLSNGVRFVWRIERSDEDGVQWLCLSGPGTSPGTTVCYLLRSLEDGRVLVTLTHHGWSVDSENMVKCNTLWGALLHHLKVYCETGSVRPAI